MDCFDECNKNKSIFFNISLPAVTLMLKNLHQLSFLIFMIIIFYEYQESLILFTKSLENQFIYPYPKGSKLIFFAPLGVGVDEENQCKIVHGL